MDHAARGAAALSSSDFPAALSEFTLALIDHPTSPDYFTQRSVAFTRLKPPRYDLALKDAEYAVLLGQKRAKREKIQAAQQRRVVALHGVGRYADAKFVLSTMEKWRPKDSKPAKMEGDMWMARIENKLKNLPESEKAPVAKEFPEIEWPGEKQIISTLKAQLNPDGSYRLDGDADLRPPDTSTTTAAAAPEGTTNRETQAPPTPSTATTSGTVLSKIRHEWYQSAETITLTLYAKNVPKDYATFDIEDDSVYISFPHPSNPSSTFTFTLDPLFALIDPAKSKATVMSTKVELLLRKAQPGQKWHSLEGIAPPKPVSTIDKTKDTPTDANGDVAKAAILSTLTKTSVSKSISEPPKDTPPSYPTSSRHGPKNWDKLANDLHAATKAKTKKATASKPETETPTKKDGEQSLPPNSDVDDEAEYDSDFESGDAVDGFFKKLYAGADDDTRRAMMKSFYESDGTSLSTNWAEVGKGKVEPYKSKHAD